MIFTSLDALVPFARRRAQRGIFDGRDSMSNQALIRSCTHRYEDRHRDRGALVILTRDTGHHSSGWWKNPDYERCWHLSLSCVDPRTGQPAPADRPFFADLARAFFDGDARLAWIEGPWSPAGRSRDVWHYRIFCDPSWSPILPRGEVYARQFTEAGWRSFSDQHGPERGDAAND